MRKFIVLAALAAVFQVGAAQASWTLNVDTGTGFVGKGDVQLAYGFNNAQMQARAYDLGFYLEAFQNFEAVCTWTTGSISCQTDTRRCLPGTGTKIKPCQPNPTYGQEICTDHGYQVHNVAHHIQATLIKNIAYDPRLRNQVTGFNLLGYSSSYSEGELPVIGGPCMGNEGNGGTWSSVDLLPDQIGGLFVTYGGTSVQLPNSSQY